MLCAGKNRPLDADELAFYDTLAEQESASYRKQKEDEAAELAEFKRVRGGVHVALLMLIWRANVCSVVPSCMCLCLDVPGCAARSNHEACRVSAAVVCFTQVESATWGGMCIKHVGNAGHQVADSGGGPI